MYSLRDQESGWTKTRAKGCAIASSQSTVNYDVLLAVLYDDINLANVFSRNVHGQTYTYAEVANGGIIRRWGNPNKTTFMRQRDSVKEIKLVFTRRKLVPPSMTNAHSYIIIPSIPHGAKSTASQFIHQ